MTVANEQVLRLLDEIDQHLGELSDPRSEVPRPYSLQQLSEAVSCLRKQLEEHSSDPTDYEKAREDLNANGGMRI